MCCSAAVRGLTVLLATKVEYYSTTGSVASYSSEDGTQVNMWQRARPLLIDPKVHRLLLHCSSCVSAAVNIFLT